VARPGNRHPLARPEFDAGTAPADTRMDRMILLLEPDQAQQGALEALLEAQQDPQSPEYQRWLTPEDFGQLFGVADSDLQQIVQWLTAQGFQVETPAASRSQIVFSGTAGEVQTAFHTEIHIYNVNGRRHYANAQDQQIPEALAEVVAGVVSLHDFLSQPALASVVPVGPSPAPSYTTGGSHYLAPADFATIYDINPLYSNSVDGTGSGIAVVARSNVNLADVASFRSTDCGSASAYVFDLFRGRHQDGAGHIDDHPGAVSVTGLPSGVSAVFTPAGVSGTGAHPSTLRVSAASTARTGLASIDIVASGGGSTLTCRWR